ncbi:TRAP transporter substrate-binding protein DctP [Azospirillum thermophilum]|uniref:TRAP transporter substrate-binding protein DctP n=1 Tax=Azospirillum thermophilum TaxID=2202148 RepID=UPI00143CD416|nr:TRAP transporter substrate-binding protein DctP [Azospirillum thermophilum]
MFLCAPATADTGLRFGTVFSPGTSTFRMLVDACRRIEEETNRAVTIDIRPSGGFGKPTELLKMVDSGEIEIAYTVQGYSPDRFPASSVMELPLIRRSAVAGTRAIWDLHESGALAGDYAGLKVVGLWTLPAYGIFTASRPLQGPRDLRGLRVRNPSTTVGRALAKLGMVPVALPLNGMGTGLKERMIDGISYGWYSSTTTAGADNQPLMAQLTYLLDINFSGPVVMLAMRQPVFDALPDPVKAAFDRHLGKAISLAIAEERDAAEEEVKAKLAADGTHKVVRFTPDQMQDVRGELEDVYDDWVAGITRQGVDGRRLLERARQAVAAHEKP